MSQYHDEKNRREKNNDDKADRKALHEKDRNILLDDEEFDDEFDFDIEER